MAMLDNMASQNSEMSAVGLYFYNNLITMGHREISDAFHFIGIVEMHHMQILQSLQCNWAKIPVSGAVIRETADTYTGVRPVCTIRIFSPRLTGALYQRPVSVSFSARQ